MTNASKAKGSRFEREVLDFIRGRHQKAERLALVGEKDEGDLAHPSGPWTFILEAKNEKKIDLARYANEATREAHNYSAARGGVPTLPAAVISRPRRGVDESYVLIPLDRFLDLTEWIDSVYAVAKIAGHPGVEPKEKP